LKKIKHSNRKWLEKWERFFYHAPVLSLIAVLCWQQSVQHGMCTFRPGAEISTVVLMGCVTISLTNKKMNSLFIFKIKQQNGQKQVTLLLRVMLQQG
jgi:hypothetical protein